VAEPAADHRDIDAGRDKLNTRGMPVDVRRNTLFCEGWYVPSCRPNILSQFKANAGRSQWLTVAVDEDHRIIGAGLSFPKSFE